MLFELIDSALTGLADLIEVGPIGMITSPMPGIEADVRRITGQSLNQIFEPVSVSGAKEIGGEFDVVDEKLWDDTKLRSVAVSSNLEAFEELIDNIKDNFSVESSNINLGLIYDSRRLNSYGKIIIDKVGADMYVPSVSLNMEEQLKMALAFKEKCQQGMCDKYAFIFWALMVLTVDDTDKEKNLSQISDFSRFLEISKEEMENIVRLIRIVYRNQY